MDLRIFRQSDAQRAHGLREGAGPLRRFADGSQSQSAARRAPGRGRFGTADDHILAQAIEFAAQRGQFNASGTLAFAGLAQALGQAFHAAMLICRRLQAQKIGDDPFQLGDPGLQGRGITGQLRLPHGLGPAFQGGQALAQGFRGGRAARQQPQAQL